MNRKVVKHVLGEHSLTPQQHRRLELLFDAYGSPRTLENMLTTIAIFVKYDLTNYVGRYRRLKGIPGTTKYTQILRYGKIGYMEIYKIQSKRKTSHFTNTTDYWVSKGYSIQEANRQVSEVQTHRARIAAEKTTGSSEYTIRSMVYWMKRGFTEEEARRKVAKIQTTNGEAWYIDRYGPDEGPKKYEKRIQRWQATLNDRSEKERLLINRKKSNSVEGYMLNGYTEQEAIEKSEKFRNKMKSKLHRCTSKISQDLFFRVSEQIGEYGCYFNDLNYEFKIDKYRVDFYHKPSKTIIEFYGDFFHRNPSIYDSEFESFGYTSKEKWDYDAQRMSNISSSPKAKNIMIVWEGEYRNDIDNTVEKCVQYIKENTVE